MKNNLKNHVAIVLDLSSSMSTLTDKMRKVFNNQIEALRRMSLQFEQEARVSVYTFADAHNIQCLISDVDMALFVATGAWAFDENDTPWLKVYATTCSEIAFPLPYKKAWLK